jgi:glutamate racemase
LLTGVISYVVGDDVTLVSSAEETAKDVYHELASRGAFRAESSAPRHRFLATGDPEPFERLGRRFLGPEVGEVSSAQVVGHGHVPA